MTIEVLSDAPGTLPPTPFADQDHPMRKVTRQVAFEDAWDAERAAKVAALFDSMAADWTAGRDGPERLASLDDALERGGVDLSGPVLEVGSGTGLGTRILRRQVRGTVVALDIAREMLRNASRADGQRVHGDASALPLRDRSVRMVVLVNALLFPSEVDRVLAQTGAVVWVNSNGDQTPIHLPAEDVARALPGEWSGVASRAGSGTWTVLHRA